MRAVISLFNNIESQRGYLRLSGVLACVFWPSFLCLCPQRPSGALGPRR
jgi:hypothetical protein